jgi:enediyne biosynthesis protein E4
MKPKDTPMREFNVIPHGVLAAVMDLLARSVGRSLQAYGLAVAITLATLGSAWAQTFTRITKGSIGTDPGSTSCAWGDYNNDGFEDLFVSNPDGRNDYLYLNNTSGAFTRIMSGPHVNDGRNSTVAVWGDYDNDGYLDLFVSYSGFPGRNALYQNAGDGTFMEVVSGSIGTNTHNGSLYGGAWGDYDNDGLLDLYGSQAAAGEERKDELHRNEGNTFQRILSGPMVYLIGGVGLGCAWGDYNNDGKLDLFIATDTISFSPVNNFLFRNDGDGVFTPITGESIVGDGGASQGCAWGDYNNDGLLDLFVSNGGDVAAAPNFLYRNTGDGSFQRIYSGLVATNIGHFVGCSWGDYDNDGFLDLFVCQFYGENNALYHNDGDGTFSRITTGRIVNDGGHSIAGIWADYDNDGFLDLFVSNLSGTSPNFLYHNDGTNNNQWLKIKCVGGPSNRAAIGAKVRVRTQNNDGDSIWQMREISGGHGIGQNSLIAHFGLGAATNAETVRIEWPSGVVQVLTNVSAKQFLTVTEPPHLQTSMTNGSFQILLTGSLGLSYGIEASTDFTAWAQVGSVTNTTRTIRFADLTATNYQQRFYRAVLR